MAKAAGSGELALKLRARKGKEPSPDHLAHKEQILAALEQRERLRKSVLPSSKTKTATN